MFIVSNKIINYSIIDLIIIIIIIDSIVRVKAEWTT